MLVWTMRDTDPAAVLASVSALSGKIIIDVNNRDFGREVRDGVWFGAAIAERLQGAAPTASVAKAFNTIAMESFGTSPKRLRKAGAQTFLAGDSAAAKALVSELTEQLGFAAVDLGTGPAACPKFPDFCHCHLVIVKSFALASCIMPKEERKAPRKAIDYPGWVMGSSCGVSNLIMCTINDVSTSGARLNFRTTRDIPDRFDLRFSKTSQGGRACRVVWRRGDDLGVAFD